MRFFTTTLLILLLGIFTTSISAQSLNFDGTDDYVAVPQTGTGILDDFSTPHSFTIEVRFKFVSSTIKKKIAANNAFHSGFFIETDNSGELLLGYGLVYGINNSISTGINLSVGTWYTCALVYNQTDYSAEVYVDGVHVASGLYNGALFTTYGLNASDAQYHPSGYEIRLADSPYWSGENGNIEIDYFRIWNEVRDASEISNNHNTEVSCTSSNLLLQYKMDDGVANNNNTGITSLSDCTTNNHNGTLNNFAMNGSSSNFTNPAGVIALPVELTAFEGFAQKNSNLLNWSTVTEENNEGFYIERSENGENWEIIGFIHGNGTTFETQYYQHEDKSPYNGKNYYRLKQIDFDGQFEYSNIITIENIHQNTNIKLFPNPVVDRLVVNSEAKIDAIVIFNVTGQPILQQSSINNQQLEINVNDLPKGVYTLQIKSNDNETVIKQFIK